jgi:hypothetical protein
VTPVAATTAPGGGAAKPAANGEAAKPAGKEKTTVADDAQDGKAKAPAKTKAPAKAKKPAKAKQPAAPPAGGDPMDAYLDCVAANPNSIKQCEELIGAGG